MLARRTLCLLAACLVLALSAGCENDSGSDDGGPQDDVATTDPGGGGGTDCETFCADQVAACPEDDTMESCEKSCDEADKAPDQAALECAAAAMDCTATRACWPMLYNPVP